MNSRKILISLLVLSGLVGMGRNAFAEFESTVSNEINREIYVPFEHLSALLENQPERVLLSRAEYESLLDKARKEPEARAPRSVILAAADYVITIEQSRAVIVGRITVEVLNDGLHTVDLDLSGVGLRAATLDGHGAPIGRAKDGDLELFVQGVGSHELVLDMVTRVETTAALQSLRFQVPTPPATRMGLVVPGNVEIRKGAHVVKRTFDEDTQTTRFDLLPQTAGIAIVADEASQTTRVECADAPGTVSLVMTLNNRLLQSRRVVIARGVIVDEITAAYERLHATFSMDVLHRPVDRFRFALPEGFEPSDVKSPLLSHWAVETDGSSRVLDVRLREPATGIVTISFSGVAMEDESRLANWTLPQISPLDVAGKASVVGILLEDGLRITTLTSERLIPIDTTVLQGALPAALFRRSAGEPRLRAVAAFYAPIGIDGTELRGRFEKPAARLSVMTGVLLTLDEKNLHARGGFSLRPEVEKIFDVVISAPSEWYMQDVTDAAGTALAFDVYDSDSAEESRIRVHLPAGVPPGSAYGIFFRAVHTPDDWLSDWSSTRVVFPVFAVAGAQRDVGAIAVRGGEDMAVYPQTLDRLTPLDENEKASYGLAEMTASHQAPAYRYESQPYHATFRVERTAPRLTARTYSFIRLDSELLTAHYEIAFEIEQARARKLSLRLPESTPPDVSIKALDGVVIKEYQGSVVDGMRRWTIELAEGHRGTVRLAVDFEQGLDTPDETELVLPIVLADDVVYQSGFVAVEGGPEVDLKITRHPRKVDVGELSGATYRPERAVLGPRRGGGVFAFVGDKPEVTVLMSRPPEYVLPSAIVQRAELVTLVSDDGVSQSAARFHLRTKAAFLQIELPEDSTLWSVELDGMPAKPQREGGHLLLSVPAKAGNGLRDLRIVYQTPIRSTAFWSDLDIFAPRLLLRAHGKDSPGIDVPVANLNWHLYLPTGFDVVNHGGTVTGTLPPAGELAVWTMAKFLYRLSGGVNFFYYLPKLSRARELSHRSLSNIKGKGTSWSSFVCPSTPDTSSPAKKTRRGAGTKKKKKKELPPAVVGGEFAEITDTNEKKGGKMAAGDRRGRWALEGVRSLKIDLERSGQSMAFQSLGHDPRLNVTLINNRRVRSLAWGLALGIGIFGLSLTNRSARTKALYVVTTFSVATLVPLISGSPGMTSIANPLVYVACILVPFYLLVRLIRWSAKFSRRPQTQAAAITAVITLVLMTCQAVQADPVHAAGQQDDPVFVRLVEIAGPMKVPDDAIIVPYDPTLNTGLFPGTDPSDRLMVPYRKYVELWNLGHPSDPLVLNTTSPGYALAGAAFSATLEGDRHLELTGYLDIDVHTDKPLAVPLQLGGGVVIRAVLDGAPARLGVARSAPPGLRSPGKGTTTAPLTMPIQGKGRHRLDLTVRLQIVQKGGWRIVAGRLPTATATTLTLEVPGTGTEVRLGGAWDNRYHVTTSPLETIETALDEYGSIGIEWRPKVHEGDVDPSLTATSDALFDVREDGLRLIWQLNLDFGRTERDGFTVIVPGGYLVQAIDGPNVRGWVSRSPEPADNRAQDQELRVTLLKPARASGNVAIVLHRAIPVGRAAAPIDVPIVQTPGAVLHAGRVTIRRSPLLSLRTKQALGVTRTDISEDALNLARWIDNGRESPFGVQAYQAYRFTTTPFQVELAVAPTASSPSVEIQTVLRIGDRQRILESRVEISPQAQPVYHVGIIIPDDLLVDHVFVPTAFEWSIVSEDDRKVLHVYLSAGRHDRFSIQIRGTLGVEAGIEPLSLPRLEVLDVLSQRGEIVVQSDPAIAVQTAELQGCREIALNRTYRWLSAEQRSLSRVAIQYSSPNYTGLVRLSFRQPIVTCSTMTNVRITATAVEETILLDFTIARAGIQSISFLLPGWMKDARISLPMLRQKTVVPVSDEPDAAVRVELLLQDDIMGLLRVLVENDRLLTANVQRAPVPVVETGRVERQFVTLENAGRDEVLIDSLVGFETLSHQQKEWRTLTDLLGGSITQAYVANAQDPLLSYKTKERVVVETAGARIGLAETVLTADASGAYRAVLSYRIDNRTEQFLEVELPKDAQLWSAMVADEPVKPARPSGVSLSAGVPPSAAAINSRRVRIPLIRTAAGDLDYVVLLKYGGRMPLPGGLRRVEFPLIRTINVPVELSQVRLFLPETQRWSNFSGTMRRVVGEGDLAAGVVRYQTRQAERLMRTMKSDSPFAQVRAATNLELLKSQTQRYRQSASQYALNSSLQQEIISNEAMVERADTQSRELLGLHRPADLNDNRDKLNYEYANQLITRARNRVQGLPDNFKQVESSSERERRGKGHFDREWLDANKMGQVDKAESSEDLEVEELQPYSTVTQNARAQRQSGQAAQQQMQTIFQFDADGRTNRPQNQQQQRVRRGETDEAVAQYRRQLARKSVMVPPVWTGADQVTIEGSISVLADDVSGWGIPVHPLSYAGGGLTSLTVEFPVRGVSFFFTTPRGQVSITARSVSNQFVMTMRRIGIALAAIAMAIVGYLAWRKWPGPWFTPRTWSTLAIVLGLTGAIIGVLPILAVLVVVAGVAAKNELRRRKRAAALA